MERRRRRRWDGGDLMKGLTSVSMALMYQAGCTTSRPFRSFFSLEEQSSRGAEEERSQG